VLDRSDEEFETYLKQFRPLPAEPLPRARRHPWRVLAAYAAAAVLLLVVSWLANHHHQGTAPVVRVVSKSLVREQIKGDSPLTVARADEMLVRSASFQAALDDLAFQHQSVQPPRGMRSALGTLGKEDFRL
jgi:hypothetical protein